MLRNRYKEILLHFIEINKEMLDEDFIPELRSFLSSEHQNDDEIAHQMNVSLLELQYLKTIFVEQMTLNCIKPDSLILNENEKTVDVRFYEKYFDAYTSGLLSINQDFTEAQSIYYLDDENLLGLFKYFFTKIKDGSAKYVYTEKDKETIYDIIETLIKYTGKYDYIVEVLYDIYADMVSDYIDIDDEDEETYNDEIEESYDDDLSEEDSNDEDISTKEEILLMFDNCFDDIIKILKNNYPDVYERNKFINFFTATCYATEKIHNEHDDMQCLLPYVLESLNEIDLERLDKSLIIAFLQELFENCFIGNGINMYSIYGLNNEKVLDVYKKIDIDIYNKLINDNNNLFIFSESLSKYIDDIIISRYEGIKINYGYQKLQDSGMNATDIKLDMIRNITIDEHREFLKNIYEDILSYDIYRDYSEFDLNNKKKSYIRNATIRRIIAVFFEGINIKKDSLKYPYNSIYDDLLRGIYKTDAEFTELFIEHGPKMLEIYYELIKDNKFLDICQNKIYNDNLVEFITLLDPTSTVEFMNRITCKNVESIMNCNDLIKQLSDANIVTKEEFLNVIKELGISKEAAVGSIATIVYENMLYSNEKDNEIAFLIENNSLEDIVKILFDNDHIFNKMIHYFRKYTGKEFDVDKELIRRKDIKVKQKEHVISRINPYYKQEQETFK